MPDGDTISIGQERFLAFEVFFQPAQIGSEEVPMHELIHKAIQNCDVDIDHLIARMKLRSHHEFTPSHNYLSSQIIYPIYGTAI